MPFERSLQSAFQGNGLAGTGQGLPVRAKVYRRDRPGEASQGVTEQFGPDAPHFNGAVVAAGSDSAVVRAKRNRTHRPGMALQGADLLPAVKVAHYNRA